MKTIRIPIFSAALMALFLPLASRAEETMSGDAAPADQAPPAVHRGPMGGLSEQERAQLKTAHDKAIQQNPSLDRAMKDARQAMEKARKDLHDAMVAADPSVAPILAKIEFRKPGGGSGRHGVSSPGNHGEDGDAAVGYKEWKHHGPPPGMANLTEQERGILKAAHERIKTDPAVVSAREALKSATTPEARRAAHEALRQAADAALLKIDPSLGPILEKLHQDGPPPPSSTASPRESMMPEGQ